ncbi:MAG TPA: methyltransferase domain-containing protein [Gaiellaceae bacterium]|nr:methyltransferase domain-containing protein [Gaiellaceae bacterium]
MAASTSGRSEPLRLHVGCGSTVVPGWVNLDKSPNVYLSRIPLLRGALARARVLTPEQASAVFPRGIVRADVRKGLPYGDGSVAYVYSSHLIEHLARWQAASFVRECRRVLAPGGVLRIATPDLADIVRGYTSGERGDSPTPADRLMDQLLTFQEHPGSRAQRLIRRIATAPHQWLYDAESLAALLEEGGFVEARTRAYREGELPDLDLLEQRSDSLIVEARRPER